MNRAMLWTAQDIVKAGIGDVSSDFNAERVIIDSRTGRPGDLFVALKGERFDGHDFVAEVLDKGAGAAMVGRIPDGLPADAPLIQVRDTQAGLEALGQAARARATGRILGITGSVGKTGTKEMLRLACEALGPAYATQGNLNNHIGTPLSLANLPADTGYGIFEMGMNHAGEIAALTRQVRPHVAIITTIAAVHIENFASVEGIADAKAEIFQGMDADGVAILNADNHHTPRLMQHAKDAGLSRIVTFGERGDATACLTDVAVSETGSEVTAMLHGTPVTYRLGTHGRHWAIASLAVLLAIHAAGGNTALAATALAHFTEPEGRGNLLTLPFGGGELTVIDDSYNASPVAMRAALQTLDTLGREHGARCIAILGDMLELGEEAEAMHAELAGPIAAHGIDAVYSAGPLMAALDAALPGTIAHRHYPDAGTAAEAIPSLLQPGDVVLVKGSRGSKMERVIHALKEGR